MQSSLILISKGRLFYKRYISTFCTRNCFNYPKMLLQLSKYLTWGTWGAYNKNKKRTQERRNGEINLERKQKAMANSFD